MFLVCSLFSIKKCGKDYMKYIYAYLCKKKHKKNKSEPNKNKGQLIEKDHEAG